MLGNQRVSCKPSCGTDFRGTAARPEPMRFGMHAPRLVRDKDGDMYCECCGYSCRCCFIFFCGMNHHGSIASNAEPALPMKPSPAGCDRRQSHRES